MLPISEASTHGYVTSRAMAKKNKAVHPVLAWKRTEERKQGKGGWEQPQVITYLPWVPHPRVWWELVPQVGDYAHSIWIFERHFSFKPKQQPLHTQETRHIAGWVTELQVKTYSQLGNRVPGQDTVDWATEIKTHSWPGNRAPSQENSRGNGMMGRGSRACYRAVKFLYSGQL